MEDQEKFYTLRWVINNKWGDLSYKGEAYDLISEIIGDKNKEEERVENDERPGVKELNANNLWCPFADTDFPSSKTKGVYSKKYPIGAIVHFTAGRRNGLKNGMSFQANKGYTYFLIDEDGNVGQNFPLNKWGYHAGKSYWPNLGSGVSKHLVGIEIQCAGNLDSQNKAWFGEKFHDSQVRHIKQKKDNIIAGRYLKFTRKQEEGLKQLLFWLKHNNAHVFSFDYVLGHDEVSPHRKVDPGGSLSMTMPEFRNLLKEEYTSKYL